MTKYSLSGNQDLEPGPTYVPKGSLPTNDAVWQSKVLELCGETCIKATEALRIQTDIHFWWSAFVGFVLSGRNDDERGIHLICLRSSVLEPLSQTSTYFVHQKHPELLIPLMLAKAQDLVHLCNSSINCIKQDQKTFDLSDHEHTFVCQLSTPDNPSSAKEAINEKV